MAERYWLFIYDIKSTSVVLEPTSIFFFPNIILKLGAILLIMPWVWLNWFFYKAVLFIHLISLYHRQSFVFTNKIKKFICGKGMWIFTQSLKAAK